MKQVQQKIKYKCTTKFYSHIEKTLHFINLAYDKAKKRSLIDVKESQFGLASAST